MGFESGGRIDEGFRRQAAYRIDVYYSRSVIPAAFAVPDRDEVSRVTDTSTEYIYTRGPTRRSP